MNNKLWNRNFSIATIGSAVSMLGNAVAGFAIGLLILDYTGSVFLYSVTIVAYTLPKIFMPFLSGPYLDRFSRRKAIYTLDFFSAFVFFIITLVLIFDIFNFPIVLVLCLIIGSVDSIYVVAFQSIYPMLITKANYPKAYSISTFLSSASQVMIPVAVFVYDSVGVIPLFAFNAVTFLIAAICETFIKVEETYTANISDKYNMKSYKEDFVEGVKYIWHEKGLKVVTIFFMVMSFAGYISGNLMMPYFKSNPDLGMIKYMYVGGLYIVGRMAGSALQYRYKFAANKRFSIALLAYFIVSVVDGSYMFMTLGIMMIFMLVSGIASSFSYNIRMSTTQHYVPNEMRARYNGAFQTLFTIGGSIGALIGGALAEVVDIPYILAGVFSIVLISIFVIIIPNKKHIIPIYNAEFEDEKESTNP